jgi:hypothetical protein
MRRVRSPSRERGTLAGAVLAGLAVACQSILGIEELKSEVRPGSAGAGGSSGSSGDAGSGGDGGSGGSGTSAGSGGGDGVAMGGSGGGPAVMPMGGAGGAPDAGSELVVSGRVIDFFRRPVPDVPVTIGGTTVATNAQGQFSIGGVTPPYDASLMLNTPRNGGVAHYGYVFEGLTLPNPTLQVYAGLPPRSGASLSIAYQDIMFEANLHYVNVAWSSPDGVFVRQASGPTEYVVEPSWSGPAATAGTIHALDAYKDVADEPPVAYQAYQALPLTVSDSQPASVGFNLPFDPTIVTGTIAGIATHQGAANSSTNSVSLLFEDGTGMPLVEATPTGDAFSYFAPIIAGSSLVVAASDGIIAPYAVAHRGNLAVGQADVALTVPRPVNLSSPQAGAPVNPSTLFSWSRLSQTAQTFLWHLEFNATYEGMFVLTSRASIELPQFPDGFTVPPGTEVTWSVETHGDAPNVDAAAGPNGYLDSFAFGTTYPVGPNRSDGYYTESERRGFAMGSD